MNYSLRNVRLFVMYGFCLLGDVSVVGCVLRDYAAIVFFASNRFETGKRKLQYLTFQDFAFCAGQLINNWTLGSMGENLLVHQVVVRRLCGR